MRKSLALMSVVVAFVVIPAVVCAQALLPIGKGGESQFFVTGAWVYSFNTGYDIDSETALLGTPLNTGDWSYDYNAFQIGLGLPIKLGDEGQYGTFLLGGTVAIPSSHKGEELITNFVATTLARKWSADTYYATLEGLWAYPIYGDWSALGGFRWVYWQTSYKSPSDIFGPGATTDTGDVTVNGYVPLLGILCSMRGLTVGAVGFPTTLGTVEHKEDVGLVGVRLKGTGDFDGGYFAEVFLEYGVPAYDLPGLSAALSVYGKASWLRTTANMKLENILIPALGTQDYDFALRRQLLFLGAKATFDFDLPSWPTSRILYY